MGITLITHLIALLTGFFLGCWLAIRQRPHFTAPGQNFTPEIPTTTVPKPKFHT